MLVRCCCSRLWPICWRWAPSGIERGDCASTAGVVCADDHADHRRRADPISIAALGVKRAPTSSSSGWWAWRRRKRVTAIIMRAWPGRWRCRVARSILTTFGASPKTRRLITAAAGRGTIIVSGAVRLRMTTMLSFDQSHPRREQTLAHPGPRTTLWLYARGSQTNRVPLLRFSAITLRSPWGRSTGGAQKPPQANGYTGVNCAPSSTAQLLGSPRGVLPSAVDDAAIRWIAWAGRLHPRRGGRDGKIYIHCAGGVGRAPAWPPPISSTRATLDEALALIRRRGLSSISCRRKWPACAKFGAPPAPAGPGILTRFLNAHPSLRTNVWYNMSTGGDWLRQGKLVTDCKPRRSTLVNPEQNDKCQQQHCSSRYGCVK